MTIRLTTRPLRTDLARRELLGPGLGGVVVFEGIVRPDRVGRRRVRALVYETDAPRARAELLRLVREVGGRTGARRTVVWHRLGVVPAGEVSVVVGAAAPHRDAAFRAVRSLIDRLKREVPIWKTDRAPPARRPRSRPTPRAGRSADSGRAQRPRGAPRRAG